ncbi:QsdR family transcriptional regulator [Streptomyces exfoliatus]|uniref:QsdR family transcriptional regulator n=1 Tax=Streptomyces exfoliatus TaxID=1905 RepID=UPI003C3021CD
MPGQGGSRIAAIVETFTRGIIEADYVHTFVSREPKTTLRLMTTRAGVVRRRIVAKVQGAFRKRWTAGPSCRRWSSRTSPASSPASATFVYADLISGDEPDATKPAAAVAALLR